MGSLALALLLADGRVPNGGHAHSAGLEAALRAGDGQVDLAAFLHGRLHTTARVDAAISAAAVRASRGEGPGSELARLDLEARARIASPPLREASRTLGRSLLRAAERIFPSARGVSDYRRESSFTPRSVALGVVAEAAGLGPTEAAYVSLYEDLASVAAAATKLMPVDAAGCFALVAGLAGQIEECAQSAARPTAPEDLPSGCAPALELRSLTHAEEERRLFAT